MAIAHRAKGVPAIADETDDRELQCLSLALTPGLGPMRARRIVEHFGSVEAVFRASLTELEATGMMAQSAQSLGTGKSLELAQEEMVRARNAGAQIVSLDDAHYPARLKEIYDPPLVLYVRGSADVLSEPGIAICRDTSSNSLRNGNGRATGLRPFAPGARHFQRDGAGC